MDGLQVLGQEMLISDELLSGYEPQGTMSSSNRRFELLLGRIGIFLHLLKVGTRSYGIPPDISSETGQARSSLPSCEGRPGIPPGPAQPWTLVLLLVCRDLSTWGRTWCRQLQICTTSRRIHEHVATAGHDSSNQEKQGLTWFWSGCDLDLLPTRLHRSCFHCQLEKACKYSARQT